MSHPAEEEHGALHNADWNDFRDHLPTVEQSGKRHWIYPKKPTGRFYRARTYVSWLLLAVLFFGPFVRINGNPLLMMNIVERKFSIFGQIFWPHDIFVFALAMLTGFIMIVLFTAVFGRVWCGWACPQTVLMEMVFRKIEYWIEGDASRQRALDKAPWTLDKIRKKLSKHTIFFGLSFLIGNLLLAYIIGSDELIKIVTEPPSQHATGLTFMVLFSLLFYGIFARFREQACTFICPYGRLQSVLLDRGSIIVSYDQLRGDPKGKKQRGQDHATRREAGTGDCIDCRLCVEVCPTGIDIRNGTQMECVNCTACIDACDSVMTKVGFPTGLVRYASEAGILEGEKMKVTPRIVGYSFILLVLTGVLTFLITSRADVQATFLRNPGTMYQELPSGELANFYTVRVMNKSRESLEVDLRLLRPEGEMRIPGAPLVVEPQSALERPAVVALPRSSVDSRQNEILVGVYSQGKLIQEFETNFVGPQSDGPKATPETP